MATDANLSRRSFAALALLAAALHERYEPDYPGVMPRPTVFDGATKSTQVAGLPLTAHVMGPGCSEAHVVLQFEDQIFVGDLVANGSHAWARSSQAARRARRRAARRGRPTRRAAQRRGSSGPIRPRIRSPIWQRYDRRGERGRGDHERGRHHAGDGRRAGDDLLAVSITRSDTAARTGSPAGHWCRILDW